MNYKDTLNLPKTGFSMKANLPVREPQYLKVWEDAGMYERIRENRKGQKKYILHDGPPYANGHIHMGHVLNKLLKDIVIKFFTLKGFDAPYVPGWDCHGLPVEHQLFKQLKLKKGQIDQVDFRNKARDYALKFVKIQKEEFKRLGIFGDWDRPYLTLQPEYEAAILKTFARHVEDGYIYKDLKPVNWCTTCETALAEAEVEYADHTSPSVYVKFAAKEITVKNEHLDPKKCKLYFIIWTTTPWTLLANVAIAIHPELEYAVIETDGEKWILLDSLAGKLLKRLGKPLNVLHKVKGKELEKSIALHPFINRESKVVLAEYVSSEDGSGCVHTAPGHGQDDYITGKKYGLDLIMPVTGRGLFDSSAGEFSGMNVHEANNAIIEKMKTEKTLVQTEQIEHSYPHCWRCKNPIIFRATEQWFMKIDHKDLREKLLDKIKNNVKWHPETGMARISSMVENRPDWCLSRQRYWGVPIPVFHCNNCNYHILDSGIITDLSKIVRTEGVDIWFKKAPKELLPEGYKCPECGGDELKRENDILDVWFESGVSHQGVLREREQLTYPCDLYLEGSDQHRGWFQSSIITSVASEGIAPYSDVLTHGFIVDGDGKKMSKSLGNVVSPENMMKKYGADIIRLWVSSSNYSDDIRLSDEILKGTADAYRKIRNTFKYLLSNLYDFDPSGDMVEYRNLESINKWMLSRTAAVVKEADKSYSGFIFHRVYREVYKFCVSEISSLYLDIMKDRLYTYKKDSFERRSVQTVIYTVLDCLVRIMSPILAFTCEEVWREDVLLKNRDSVHLSDWPDKHYALSTWANKELDSKWLKLISARESIQKSLELKRTQGIIGSSLDAGIALSANDKELKKALEQEERFLPVFFMVSETTLKEVPDGECDKYEEGKLSVSIYKAKGEKCERCWNFSSTVGLNTEHPALCQKCLDNI